MTCQFTIRNVMALDAHLNRLARSGAGEVLMPAAALRLREEGAEPHIIASVFSSVAASAFTSILRLMAADLHAQGVSVNDAREVMVRMAASTIDTHAAAAGQEITRALNEWREEDEETTNATKH